MSATASGTKACVRCHKDLTGHRRLKDHNGQYWCADCGHADNAARHPPPASGHCHDCHGRYPAADLHTDGEDTVCTGCLAGREKERRQLNTPRTSGGVGGGLAGRRTDGSAGGSTGKALAIAAAVAAILFGAWGMGWV